MKNRFTLISAVLILCLFLCCFAGVSAADQPGRPILAVSYTNYAWGYRYEAGFLDENGVCWTLAPAEEDGHVSPDLLHTAYPASAYTRGKQLKSDRLFTLKGLILSAENRVPEYQPVACDAGSFQATAIRYSASGDAEVVILGAAGDDLYENTDPTAQALYAAATELFPGVQHFADDPMVAPMGFQPNGLFDFLGIPYGGGETLILSAVVTDCEAGPEETEPSFTAEELLNMRVTGKANSGCVTGGTQIITVRNASGETIGSVEFWKGLLVTGDGMYYVE